MYSTWWTRFSPCEPRHLETFACLHRVPWAILNNLWVIIYHCKYKFILVRKFNLSFIRSIKLLFSHWCSKGGDVNVVEIKINIWGPRKIYWYPDMQNNSSSLAALAEIFWKLAEIPTFFKRALVFPIGGQFDLKICWRKSFKFLHVCGGTVIDRLPKTSF